jgi:uncharacterized protein YndB with AHSA1/START domain
MTTTHTLEVEQVVPAPVDEVFDAWLDPATLKVWMAPASGMTVPDVVVNPVVGGRFRLVMHDGTRTIPHEGEYLTIERPKLLVFTWVSEPAGDTVVTVRFERVDERHTRVVLTHDRFARASARDGHRTGWTRILASFATALTHEA